MRFIFSIFFVIVAVLMMNVMGQENAATIDSRDLGKKKKGYYGGNYWYEDRYPLETYGKKGGPAYIRNRPIYVRAEPVYHKNRDFWYDNKSYGNWEPHWW